MPSSKKFLSLLQEEKRKVWAAQQRSWRERHPFKEKYANDPEFRRKTIAWSSAWKKRNPEKVKFSQKRYMAKIRECWRMFKDQYYEIKNA